MRQKYIPPVPGPEDRIEAVELLKLQVALEVESRHLEM